MHYLSKDPQTTHAIGQKIAKEYKHQDVWLLVYGDLGAGKTELASGILYGMGLRTKAQSPTFTYLKPYHFKNTDVYHLDLYRLENYDELTQKLSLEELSQKPGIKIVEWPDIATHVLYEMDISIGEIHIRKTDKHTRNITLTTQKQSQTTRPNTMSEIINTKDLEKYLNKTDGDIYVDFSGGDIRLGYMQNTTPHIICSGTNNSQNRQIALKLLTTNIPKIANLYVCEGPGSFSGIRALQVFILFFARFADKSVYVSPYHHDIANLAFYKVKPPMLNYYKEPRIG